MTTRIKLLLCICITLFLLSGCSAIKAVSILRGGESVDENRAESIIDFNLKFHMILVKARLNDSPKEYTFMVDTGAFNVVREDVARDIGLEKGVEVNAMSTGGGNQKIRLVRLAKLSVGGMEVKECGIGVFDFSLIEQMTGVRLDGILGSNFLRHFRVTIDYGNKKLTLARSAPPMDMPPGGYRLKFEQTMFFGFAPEIEHVMIGNNVLDAVIDTGARESVISMNTLGKLKSTGLPIIKGIGATGGGAFKLQEQSCLLRIDCINIGPLVTRHLPVIAVDQQKESQGKIFLGKNFLERYLVTIDYPANELTLVPAVSGSETTNFYSSGLLLKYDKDGFLYVMGLWQGSPADRAGLTPGDRIERVNGQRADAVSLAEINGMLRDNRVSRIEFEVRHDKEKRNVVLRKTFLFPEIHETAMRNPSSFYVGHDR